MIVIQEKLLCEPRIIGGVSAPVNNKLTQCESENSTNGVLNTFFVFFYEKMVIR